jgi:hypothetical protein
MATNKLFEAAADILAKSKSSAPAEAMPKLDGASYEDLGGPTPQNSKPDDDSNKIDSAKGAKEAPKPTTKPSAASAKMEDTDVSDEEVIAEEEVSLKEMSSKEKMKRGLYNKEEVEDLSQDLKDQVQEDIEAMFADDSTISESFKTKATTIFEARVYDRVNQIQEEIETRYADMLEEAIDAVKTELTEQVDDYLNYVVEHWIEENQIAIEKGLRSELTEDFIAGLRNLFAEHYIDVPEDKVDLVEELAVKVEALEGQLNEEIERGISYKKALVESTKNEILHIVCEGLTTTQVEKIKSLAESAEFSTAEEYAEKLETIRENYFPSGVKKAEENQLHEEILNDGTTKAQYIDPFVAAVTNNISKINRNN